jgi:hypothetical protein
MTSPTFIPRYTGNNVLTGPAQIWTQPYSFTTPATLPADTIALGGLWASPWTAIGATKQGIVVDINRQTTDITIEEQMTPVDQRTTAVHFNFTAQLSEDTLETMLLAYGGGAITVTAAASAVKGKKTLVLHDELDYIVVGMESFAAPRVGMTGGEIPWRRVLVPKVSSAAQVQTPYRRATEQRIYPVTFSSLVPLSACTIVELNASALP